jgi:iron complex outermembrane receptor protein
MRNFKLTKIALLVGTLCSASALWAQQTAPTDIGRIAVEGLAGGASTGLITQEETPKARSSVSKAHLDSLNPTNNPYQAIELLPGVNTFSYDATGLFGGGLRVRGFNSDQLGFTINGAPVNDSGNFAVYPMEYTDTENLCEVFITQGSTDSEAPHVGASGGNIGMVSCAPADKYRLRLTQTVGQLNSYKTFARLDTGKFANGAAKFFISLSKGEADKFKGEGKADRNHMDMGLEFQATDALKLSSSLLYNRAVNNFIRGLTKAQISQYGSSLDYGTTPPQHLVPGAGIQKEVAPADGYYNYALNPFRNYLWTGKAEYKVSKDLSFSAEPYFWYGFGGGSGLYTLAESSAATKLGGGIADINGDGDTQDTIMAYRSSVTQTYRPGVTLKSNVRLNNHNLMVGYWFERARHFQTQPYTTVDNAGNVTNLWLDNTSQLLKRADGTTVEGRNQATISTGSSAFVQDSINLMQDKLNLQLGLRNSEIKRDFTNFANEGSNQGADYNINKTYSKVLPSLGLRYSLNAEQQVFFNMAGNMKAPGNFSFQSLYKGVTFANGVPVTTGATLRDPVVGMETSTNLDLGYRFANDKWTFSGSVYYVDFKNRIAQAWDGVALATIDYNVGNVTTKGFELETGRKLDNNWSLYGSLSYTDSKMQSDCQCTYSTITAIATVVEPTSGKQMPDTPKWMSGLRLGYNSGNWFGNADVKYTGSAYSTLVNDESVDPVTLVNASIGYKFADTAFMKKPKLMLNVTNLFDQNYLRINSGSGSNFTPRALGANGQPPSYYVSAPRFISVTLRTDF